ncbi:restriction endonuclease [Streptomyces sp. NPDC059759]|uniref:restriction endonuclease n=1 Tax=Streptomyces sp. NPDC059759 TaxID=3346936 RepID=UPI003659157A
MAPRTGTCDVTRPSRDGGRDAVGQYILGPASSTIAIDFALEAKCYSATNSVGVREVSRLISRIRHRNFGVLVTTSYFHKQVQEEVHDDGHPIALVCGTDIVEVLRQHGHTTVATVRQWLQQGFPQQHP